MHSYFLVLSLLNQMLSMVMYLITAYVSHITCVPSVSLCEGGQQADTVPQAGPGLCHPLLQVCSPFPLIDFLTSSHCIHTHTHTHTHTPLV